MVPSNSEPLESLKDVCGGEDQFKVPGVNNAPLEMFIQYPQRNRLGEGFTYSINKKTWPGVRVSLTYSLFSLEADKVIYDPINNTIKADGDVIVDTSGSVKHGNSIVLRLKNGQAELLSTN
jgi:hypothetical protein